MRAFSFKPSSKINFIENKALLVENDKLIRIHKYVLFGFISVPSLMLYRLIVNYSSMGWINFILSSGVFIGLGSITKSYLRILPHLVRSLHLKDDGKQLEITTFGLKSQPYTINISDILNPEESLQTKMKIQYYSAWIIDTKQGETFYIMPDTASFHTDVLKEILRGQEIDVSEEIKKDSETFIDI